MSNLGRLLLFSILIAWAGVTFAQLPSGWTGSWNRTGGAGAWTYSVQDAAGGVVNSWAGERTFGTGPAGGASVSVGNPLNVGAGAGARVGVTVPTQVRFAATAQALGQGAFRFVRSTPGGIVTAVAVGALLDAAKLSYENGKWVTYQEGAWDNQRFWASGSLQGPFASPVAACAAAAPVNLPSVLQFAGGIYRNSSTPAGYWECEIRDTRTGEITPVLRAYPTGAACPSGQRAGAAGQCIALVPIEVPDPTAQSMLESATPTLSDAQRQQLLDELLRSSTGVQLSNPQISGPASVSSGNRTSTTTGPNGTTTTVNNTTVNITYNNASANVSVANTSETTDENNETTTTEDDGEPSPDRTPEDDNVDTSSASDVGMPPLPKLYEPKYPEGLIGVWNQKRDALNQSSFIQAIAALTPNLGDGGCPAWSVSLDFASWAMYGTHDVSLPCWVWTAIRAFMLVTALFMARRLIFGG